MPFVSLLKTSDYHFTVSFFFFASGRFLTAVTPPKLECDLYRCVYNMCVKIKIKTRKFSQKNAKNKKNRKYVYIYIYIYIYIYAQGTTATHAERPLHGSIASSRCVLCVLPPRQPIRLYKKKNRRKYGVTAQRAARCQLKKWCGNMQEKKKKKKKKKRKAHSQRWIFFLC